MLDHRCTLLPLAIATRGAMLAMALALPAIAIAAPAAVPAKPYQIAAGPLVSALNLFAASAGVALT